MCDSRAECWRTWGSRCRTHSCPDKLHRSRIDTRCQMIDSCMDRQGMRPRTNTSVQKVPGGVVVSSGGTLGGESRSARLSRKTSYRGGSSNNSFRRGSALMGIAIVSELKSPKPLSMDPHWRGKTFAYYRPGPAPLLSNFRLVRSSSRMYHVRRKGLPVCRLRGTCKPKPTGG